MINLDQQYDIKKIEKYVEGMEDGFVHYGFGQDPLMFGEFYSDHKGAYPKNCYYPVLINPNGGRIKIHKDGYILTRYNNYRFSLESDVVESLIVSDIMNTLRAEGVWTAND